MPKLSINGDIYEIDAGERLVLAIEDKGYRIGHRCGGYAQCTTCRVEFRAGDPGVMTIAEYEKLNQEGLFGEVRLSCQVVCDHDMSVHPVMTAENRPEWEGDTGPEPELTVTPEAIWYPIDMLKSGELWE